MSKVSILFAMIGACAGCASIETPRDAVARVGADALVRDAGATQNSVVRSLLPTRTPVDYDAKIAPKHWGPAIHALKPKYVYFHGVNIVAVLKTNDGTESGLYIELPIASTGFNASDQEIWSGTLITNSIYAITRQGKHNKGVQPTSW